MGWSPGSYWEALSAHARLDYALSNARTLYWVDLAYARRATTAMLDGGTFSERVWQLATTIPPGRVTSYGILARAAGGGAMAARSITSILAKAPNQRAIPYHRIVYADGRVWTSKEHDATRKKLYRKESITIADKGKIEGFQDVLWDL